MNKIVESNRVLYTPSEFAKSSLIYLQEVGESKTLEKHTNSRNKLDSYLFFIVLDGNGALNYNNTTYNLQKGSCVFIDCNNKYSHTSDNWTIKWAHFNGNAMKAIYKKYIDLNVHVYFETNQLNKYIGIIDEVHSLAKLNNNTKDFSIYNSIVSLLSLIFEDSISLTNNKENRHIYDIHSIKNFVDENYTKNISLEDISKKFYINKYYLIRLFKNTYGVTINRYMQEKRITKAKELLRFEDMSINEISTKCGFNDTNYFIRLFKQIESVTPKEYRKLW